MLRALVYLCMLITLLKIMYSILTHKERCSSLNKQGLDYLGSDKLPLPCKAGGPRVRGEGSGFRIGINE